MKTAVVIGSTGLIGQNLIAKLAQDRTWGQILTIGRRPQDLGHPKSRHLVFDFKNWSELEMQIKSYAQKTEFVFFCCLGTTLKVAKSEVSFKKIDLDAVNQFAVIAQNCQAGKLIVISSMGADENSPTFYLQVKGQMESEVRKSFKSQLYFLRPSLLLGDRKELRIGERIAILLAPALMPIMFGKLKKYKPIKATSVASVMVKIATQQSYKNLIVENDEIHLLAEI